MRRITQDQEKDLQILLWQFKATYPNMDVLPGTVDITNSFGGTRRIPYYLREGSGDGPIVVAYVARDAPAPRKYNPDSHEPRPRGGKKFKRTLDNFPLEYSILSMLCIEPLKNTCYSEFADFIEEKANPTGMPDTIIRTIDRRIREFADGDFDTKRDNAFLFCRGSKEKAEATARLNALWLEMMEKYGGDILAQPASQEELELARIVLPTELLSNPTEEQIRKNSYRYGDQYHKPESAWFLAAMIERYEKFSGG